MIPIALIKTSGGVPEETPPEESTDLVFDTSYVQASKATAIVKADGGRNLWMPDCEWRDGKTYWAWQGPIELPYRGQVRMAHFNETTGFTGPHLVGTVGTGTDVHNVPALTVDNNNNVWIVQENVHNTPLDVYKVTFNPNFAVTKQGWTIGNNIAYPNLIHYGDGFVLWSRSFGNYQAHRMISEGDFESWPASETQISSRGISWHYETVPRRGKVGSYYYVCISQRRDPGYWHQHNVLLTQDFVTFRNMAGTFSINIVTGGVINNTVLAANYNYWTVTVSQQSCIPVSCISPSGDFYSIQGDGTGNYYLVWQFLNSATIYQQLLTIPNLYPWGFTSGDQENPYSAMYVFDHDNILIVVLDEDSKNRLYRSTDQGASWTDEGLIFPEFSGPEWKAILPKNIFDIPVNRNFAVFAAVDFDVAGCGYIGKKAAFGAIQ